MRSNDDDPLIVQDIRSSNTDDAHFGLKNAISKLDELHSSGAIDDEEERRRKDFLSISMDEHENNFDETITYDYDSDHTGGSAWLPIIEIGLMCSICFRNLFKRLFQSTLYQRRRGGSSTLSRFDDNL
jgi:hypothetical protein